MDTAPTVVPVPTVVSRASMASSSTESNSTSKSSSVRLLLNSNSDSLMPIQQQFTFFPSARLQMNEQIADRPIVINSGNIFSIFPCFLNVAFNNGFLAQ